MAAPDGSKSAHPAAPDIKPIRVKAWDVPQSRYPQCAQLPLRSIIMAPSGGGKGILLQSLILDIYPGLLRARLHIFAEHPRGFGVASSEGIPDRQSKGGGEALGANVLR